MKDYNILKPIISAHTDVQLDYVVTVINNQYYCKVTYDKSKYVNLRDIPRECLNIPEQMLLNILANQQSSEHGILVQKDYVERFMYFLRDVRPELTKDYVFAGADLKLQYNLEINRQNCRVYVDLTKSGFASLRDVPRESLSAAERVFISFLAGVPINLGCFFVNQHLLSKLFYLLQRVDQVYNKVNGKKIDILPDFFNFSFMVKLVANNYNISLVEADGATPLDYKRLQVLGEKSFALIYKNQIYILRQLDYNILSSFILEHPLKLDTAHAADFLTTYVPFFTEHGLKCNLPKDVQKLQSKIITRSPIPILSVEKQGDQVEVKVLYDYGLPEKIHYDPHLLSEFYDVSFEGETYFLKRDKKSEEWLHNYLVDQRFMPTKDVYHIHEDDFIDFFSYQYDGLKKNIGLQIEGDNLQQFRFDEEADFSLDVDFKEASGIDWFEFSPTYKVKNASFTHEQIKDLIEQEKEYVRLEDGTLVKIPMQQYEYLQSYLDGRKADPKSGKYKVKKYDVYYLYSSIRTTLKAKVDSSLQTLISNLDDFKGIEQVDLPTAIQGTPRSYQKEGYHWLAFLQRNAFHGILADDMGLGKTFQVLMLIAYLKQTGLKHGPSLIVAPTSVVYNWVAEVNKFTPQLKVLVLSGTKDRVLKVKEIANYDIVITSYALLRNDLDHYAQQPFYYLILDEAQYIKNAKSQIAKAVKCVESEFRLALTGTPIENRLTELWSIFDFLMPGFLSTASYFRSVYDADRERLKRKIKPFIIRRTKAEVLTDLPPKNEIDSFCELLPEQEQVYLAILQAQKKEIFSMMQKNGIEKIQMNILASLLRLRQICCHPSLLANEKLVCESAKFNQFKELVDEILEGGNKVIVFSQFVQMLSIMRNYLEEQKIPFAYLDGSTKNRQEVINEFNEQKQLKVFLCSLKAGGIGINLTAANYVIIYDPWWNPAVEQQAMDRVYRIGQTKEVFVYKLITKGTVEEKILKLQEKKRALIDEIIVSDKTSEKKLTKEDLEDLFSY